MDSGSAVFNQLLHNATQDQLTQVIEAAKEIKNEQWKSDVLIVVARNAKDETVLNKVIEAANGMNEKWKSYLLREFARNAKATTETLTQVIEAAKDIKNEEYKSKVLSAVKSNTNFKKSQDKGEVNVKRSFSQMIDLQSQQQVEQENKKINTGQSISFSQMITDQSQQKGGQNQGNGI